MFTIAGILTLSLIVALVGSVIYYTVKYYRMYSGYTSSNYTKIIEEIRNALVRYKDDNGSYPEYNDGFDYLLFLKDLKLGKKHVVSQTELHTNVNCILDYYVLNSPVVKSYETRNQGKDVDVVFYTFEELKNMSFRKL